MKVSDGDPISISLSFIRLILNSQLWLMHKFDLKFDLEFDLSGDASTSQSRSGKVFVCFRLLPWA